MAKSLFTGMWNVSKFRKLSQFWPLWIEKHTVFWVGMWCRNGPRKRYKPVWNMLSKPSNTTPMPFLLITRCERINRKPILWKQWTLMYAITWNDWLADRDASPEEYSSWRRTFNSLFTVITTGNSRKRCGAKRPKLFKRIFDYLEHNKVEDTEGETLFSTTDFPLIWA